MLQRTSWFQWKPVSLGHIIASNIFVLLIWTISPKQAIAFGVVMGFVYLLTEKAQPALEFGNVVRRLYLAMNGPATILLIKLVGAHGNEATLVWVVHLIVVASFLNYIGAPKLDTRAQREVR